MVFFILFKFKEHITLANSGDPNQMTHSVAPDLGLHCLPMLHKKDAMLIWIKVLNSVCV